MADSTTLQVVIRAIDNASASLDKIRDKIKKVADDTEKYARMATVGGLAIAAALGYAVKAAEDEKINIAKLEQAMKNVGLSYDDVSDSLEKQISMMQSKTNYDDSMQRDSLASLVIVTKDVNKAFDYMTLAMDIAAGNGIDLSSATDLVTKAIAGNWGMVQRIIPAIATASSEEEKWSILRQSFAAG